MRYMLDTLYKEFFTIRKKLLAYFARISLFVMVVTIVCLFSACGNSSKKAIGIIKNGVLHYWPDKMIGKEAEEFFEKSEYYAFQDMNENWYVNLSGTLDWEQFQKDFTHAAYNYIFDMYMDIYYGTEIKEINIDIEKTFIDPIMLDTVAMLIKDVKTLYQFKVNPKNKVFEFNAVTVDGEENDVFNEFMLDLLMKDYEPLLENLMPELYTPNEIVYSDRPIILQKFGKK